MLTVHHLTQSRSDRILWLLEELEMPYQLETHERNELGRAPASLKNVHPLGKAPALTDGDLLVTESGAIVEYILEKYGDGKFKPPATAPAFPAYLEWMHFAEGTAMAQFVMVLFLSGELLPGIDPHPLAPAVTSEMETWIAHVDQILQGRDYLAGEAFTAADIMMGWVLFMLEGRGKLDRRDAIGRYLRRLEGRAAYQRMVAKR